ncbi:MAG: cell division/cell wall cluster transcriptional repressor MraZ [Patescibacteria group bacterium]
MLIGEYKYNIDQKGRVMIPAKFRNEFGIEAIITRGIDKCLFLFPKSEWEKVVEKLLKLPLSQANSRAFARLILSGAHQVEIDNQGRILIPETLRKYASLTKKVVIVGLYSRLEIWDETFWEEYKKESESQAMDIAEKLTDLGI